MANPILTGISLAEQELLYNKLSVYNPGRASYKEAGAYLVVLPRPERPQHTLWIYSPLPERQAIFFICNLSENIQIQHVAPKSETLATQHCTMVQLLAREEKVRICFQIH